ncbi:MAG: hypothetical protein QN173_01665 [Armatimonadota bacterium]|nr:hypothetical protein [Armatimonadota bacterium]MDR7401082.1 hypothetical protein [Armatimonadota bacterium]MDR7403566.1 hypothetical protein [Armatimonadota bacterium]MDR7436377.1 hypothetical protein [Armatimonadota bacterium]MDR7471734.1 hypothetical protein [Armatimonadota bacterium]
MTTLVCAVCGHRGPRAGEWFEGTERDLLLDPDETAVEEGAVLCGDCYRRLDPEERPRWRPLEHPRHRRRASRTPPR